MEVATKDFPLITTKLLVYNDFDEIPDLLEPEQESLDAVIFGGLVGMAYAHKYLKRKTLWLGLPRSGSSIFRVLLLAMRHGYNIESLSYDSYEPAILREVFLELNYDIPDTEFRCFKGNKTDSSYSEDVLQFHIDNYRHKGVSACITGLQKVNCRLDAMGIPNFMVYPTRSVIREQLFFAQQFHQARQEAKGQIMVMMVGIGFPSDYSIMLEGDDSFILEKMKIVQHIHRYAGQLQASMLEESPRDFMLLSTKDVMALETQQFTRLALLEWMEREVNYPVSVGIGHGDTVALAKKNAVRAMLRARKERHNAAYVHMSDGNLLGPILPEKKNRDKNVRIDDKFLQIAEKADLSINTVYNLHRFLVSTQKDGYTSQEIAKALKYSKRNTDRLLQRLEQNGYVSVIGKRILGKAGRPVRILTFHRDLY